VILVSSYNITYTKRKVTL